jgi:23S rRNA (cytidine2498-2'-O)-methyltransferase
MHLLLWAEDSAEELRAELAAAFHGSTPAGFPPAFLRADFPVPATGRLPHLAFARQWLPDARGIQADSIRTLAAALCEAIVGVLPDDQPWTLHVEPRYGVSAAHHIGARAWHSATRSGKASASPPLRATPPTTGLLETPVLRDASAGRQRADLVRAAACETLQRKRRHLLRRLRAEHAPFTPADSLVQFILTAPDAAVLSVALAPLPFAQRHLLAPFASGEIPLATDVAAPSRAFAKLVEAEHRLGRRIQPGETCVDLGAAPGSWTYVAVQRGARVTAVDRAMLRPDLMHHPQVTFQPGDAFRFTPGRPVDWLLCDVIATPDRSAGLLLEWLRRQWCRRFIVTLKTGDAASAEPLARLKSELPRLTSELFLARLCANKKELCVFGAAATGPAGA